MPTQWEVERDRVVRSFDRIADLYVSQFSDKLARKRFDMEFVDMMLDQIPVDRPLLEVGAGPAQFSAIAIERGLDVIISDASEGQLETARRRFPGAKAIVADLKTLEMEDGYLGGIAAYYCVMYGSADHLDGVFAEWWRALAAGGLIFVAVHAGEGSIRMTEWMGRDVDIELVMRDPERTKRQIRCAGFDILRAEVRDPMPEEHPTKRLFILARKNPAT